MKTANRIAWAGWKSIVLCATAIPLGCHLETPPIDLGPGDQHSGGDSTAATGAAAGRNLGLFNTGDTNATGNPYTAFLAVAGLVAAALFYPMIYRPIAKRAGCRCDPQPGTCPNPCTKPTGTPPDPQR